MYVIETTEATISVKCEITLTELYAFESLCIMTDGVIYRLIENVRIYVFVVIPLAGQATPTILAS